MRRMGIAAVSKPEGAHVSFEALRYLWWVAYLHPLEGVAFKRQYFPRQEAAFWRCDMDVQAGMLARLFKRSQGTQRRMGGLRRLV